MEIKNYRKKPIIIRAIQFDGSKESIKLIKTFGTSVISKGITGLTISTLEGEMKASVGDYIIEGIEKEIYPCKPEIFQKTYELVEKLEVVEKCGCKTIPVFHVNGEYFYYKCPNCQIQSPKFIDSTKALKAWNNDERV